MSRRSEDRGARAANREIRAENDGNGRVLGCARACGERACCRRRRERRHRQVRGRLGRGVLRPDGRARAEAVRDDDALHRRAIRRRSRTGRRSTVRFRSRSSQAFASRSPSIPIRRARSRTARRRRPAFAAWLTLVAQRYPTVHQYVVMNEPNQPAFVRPQFGPTGKIVSAARAGAFLAAGYDALKAVDPTIQVIGLGLSPRGQRSAHRDEQRLDLTGAVPRRARRVVPRQRPHAAADGRPQLPPVSRPGDRPARARLPLAQGGLREPRPHQAGDVGRVPARRRSRRP